MHTIENTLFIGRCLEHLAHTDSTNQYATTLLSKSKPPEGTVISAYKQSNGRGQIGSSWESEAGKNLTFSVILYPTFLNVSSQFALTQSLSLGVLDALRSYVPNELSLKWPNDIYVGNKKIGGMLLQNSINRVQLMSTIAGIGLNINQDKFQSNAPNPISLKQILRKDTDLSVLLNSLCSSLEQRYLQLRSGDFNTIKKDYLNHLYRFMEDHLYKRPDGTLFKGRIVDVLPEGRLLLIHDQGEEAFGMKEIAFVY